MFTLPFGVAELRATDCRTAAADGTSLPCAEAATLLPGVPLPATARRAFAGMDERSVVAIGCVTRAAVGTPAVANAELTGIDLADAMVGRNTVSVPALAFNRSPRAPRLTGVVFT